MATIQRIRLNRTIRQLTQERAGTPEARAVARGTIIANRPTDAEILALEGQTIDYAPNRRVSVWPAPSGLPEE